MVPDYYSMLGIDPRSDRAMIEQALARCQPAWSSGTRNPKTKHTYQSYLDQIPALRRILLGDPAARASYDAELASRHRVERDARLDELQRLLRLRAAKGGLTISDRTLLRAEAQRLGLSHADLDRLAESIPPLPETPDQDEPPDEAPVDVIDPAMRRQIRTALEHLRRRDLYHVLDLPRDAPASEIQVRSDAERKRWMHKAQVTAEKTAWLEAISYAQSHLVKPQNRVRYNRTLVMESENSFSQSIAFAIQGLDRLDPGTRQVLLDDAAAQGIAPERAERLIQRSCRDQAVSVVSTAGELPAERAFRLLRCRVCGGVTLAEDGKGSSPPENCRHCNASLRWDCPACRRGHLIDEPRCACGFPVEHLEPVNRHLDAAQHAVRERGYPLALDHLKQVLALAPQHPGARRAVEKIKQRIVEVEQAREAFVEARSGGKVVAARTALEAWSRLVDPLDPDLTKARAEITRRLRDASTLCARAGSLKGTNPAAAREQYRQALALAADLPEALDGLKQCPPDPPANLTVDTRGGPVRLRWSASVPDGLGPLTYRVVRKSGQVPAHAADGVLVAELTATEAQDTGATPGEVFGYAVFSRRADIDSIRAASHEPILVLGEVRDLRVEAQRGEVVLFWNPPLNAVGVVVVRKVGSPPHGLGDGTRVESLRDQAIDRGLDETRVYHYLVHAQYRLPDGQIVSAPGVAIAALPHAPGEAVDGLSFVREPDGRLRLSWRSPGQGQVLVLRTPRPLVHPVGTRLERSQVRSIDGQWLDAAAPGHAFDPQPPVAGVCHYTPMTSWAGSLTVGRGVAYSCVPDPADLRAVRVSGTSRVHLRWRWSPQGTMTMIVARAGAYPQGPDDPNAESFRVTESEYSRLGYHSLNLPNSGGGAWHLALYAVASLEGERIISQGLDPTSRTVVPGPHPEVTVSYSFRPPRFPGRPWSLTFRTEPPGEPIPAMALVVHPRTVPLCVEDGDVIDQFPASRDGATFRVRSRLNLGSCRARLFADPRANPSEVPPIRVRHPEAGGTRV